jgi:hypothetical protein
MQDHYRPNKCNEAVHYGRIPVEEQNGSCAHKESRKCARNYDTHFPHPQEAAEPPHQEKYLEIIDNCGCYIDGKEEIGQVPQGNNTDACLPGDTTIAMGIPDRIFKAFQRIGGPVSVNTIEMICIAFLNQRLAYDGTVKQGDE